MICDCSICFDYTLYSLVFFINLCQLSSFGQAHFDFKGCMEVFVILFILIATYVSKRWVPGFVLSKKNASLIWVKHN